MNRSSIEFMARSAIESGTAECDFIEYMSSDGQKASILKTACAYANSYMRREIGLILIGVEEREDPSGGTVVPKRPVKGVDDTMVDRTKSGLRSLLAEVCPRIDYLLLDVEIDDRKVVVVAVEAGPCGPYTTSEKAQADKGVALRQGRYIRTGRSSRLPNRREELELLRHFSDFHFSSELNEGATIDDLNLEWIREYLMRTGAAENMRAMSKPEISKVMGLVGSGEDACLMARNYAVLMFCDRPQDFIPYARVEIIREVRGSDAMKATVFCGPIWIQVRRAIDFFEEVVQRSYTVREPNRTRHRIVRNWPKVAFAELLTNAVLHKEYEKHDYVGVYVYEDEISIINHNRPLPPVTIEDLNELELFEDREYVNPELKEMFSRLGLAESRGSGIRRAKDAMRDAGNPTLRFKPNNDTDDYTMVTLPINEEFALFREEEGK